MPQLLQIRVFLTGERQIADPGIYRILQISSDLSFFQLHSILQLAFGWTNSHSHEFEDLFLSDLCIGNLIESLDEPDRVKDSRKIKIRPYLSQHSLMFYTYDMGDQWKHILFVEQVLADQLTGQPPVCLSGAGNCPPEDCGGLRGYYQMLAILKKGKGSEYEEYINWLGEEYNPDEFNVSEINDKLKRWKKFTKEWEPYTF